MRTIVARPCMSEDGIVDRPEQWNGGVLAASYHMIYAATAAASRWADSAGRWGGTRRTDRVATSARPAIRTHA